jgi:uncharacterized protein
MTLPKRPTFSELSRDESVALLERHQVGRLAFTFHDRVDIEPISYVHSGEWLYARTSLGTKLTTMKHHPWVALEVDEIEGRFDWQSVVVRGTIYFIDPDRDRHDYEAAVAVLRTQDADALSDEDATPLRQSVFRIHTDEITGRAATWRGKP